jgi:hypothetical protein
VNLTGLTDGTERETAATVIRKHLSQAIGGPMTDALIEALAWSDDVNWTNTILAFDQLFKVTASGKYLTRLAANDGLERPKDLGISDDLFRLLAIRLNANKITLQALREVLEIFYGRDALHAYAETSLAEPFSLSSGLDLEWTIDESQSFRVEFLPEWFTQITSASALEVSSVLTKVMSDAGSTGFAVSIVDPETGETRIRIYSGSLGLKSFVRVVGGRAQPWLRFDSYKEVYGGSAAGLVWVYSVPSPNVTRLSLTTVGIPLVDVSIVEPGDYLVVGSGVGTITPGTYRILDVSTEWSGGSLTQRVDLDADLGFVGAITQSSNDDYRYFSPTKKTTLNGSRTVVVAQVSPHRVDIQIPATTQVVNRNPHSAAYARIDSSPRPPGDPGPYIYDPQNGLAVTAIQSTLTSPLLKSQHYEYVDVLSAADFPEGPGYFVLGFGRSLQSSPIKYLKKIGPTRLLIDFGYGMEFDYLAGTTIDCLSARGPWVPASPADTGNFYITGSAAGRLVAQSTSTDAAAAGIELDFTVVFPGDRGLGGEGNPTEGPNKLSDIVGIFGGDEV